MPNWILRACLALVALCFAAGIGFFAGAQEQPRRPLRTLKPGQVARVGDSTITAEQYVQRVLEYERTQDPANRMAARLLDSLVAERMLDLEAERLEARIKPRELEAEVTRMVDYYKDLLESTNRDLLESQRKAGQPERPWTWAEWLRERLQVTELEFNATCARSARNTLLKRMIIWYWYRSSPNIDVLLIENRSKEKIDEASRRVAAGEDFATLVPKFSSHRSASQNIPGMFAEVIRGDGSLSSKASDIAWALKDKATSTPFEDDGKWYLVKRLKSNSNPVNEAAFALQRDDCLKAPNIDANMFERWRNAVASSGRYVYERRMPGWDCEADEP